MKIEIVKPIAGRGDFVAGFQREFALDRGMQVEVKDEMAVKWLASGIAKPVKTVPESAVLNTLEAAVRPRPVAKPRKGAR